MRSHVRGAALACLVLAGLAGCSPSGDVATGQGPHAQPRLVLVYATCSLNKDYIAPYGAAEYTPHLSAFADDSLAFQRHMTEVGASGIAFAAMFTGGLADHHGVYYHPNQIAPDVQMLSEVFADAGYDTWFWDSHPMSSRRLNYAQGVPPEQVVTDLLHGESPVLQQILERLRTDPSYKVFLLHNNAVPHAPYATANRVREFVKQFPDRLHAADLEGIRERLQTYRDESNALQFNFDLTVERLGWDEEDVGHLTRLLDVSYRTRIQWLDSLFGATVDAIDDAGLADESLVVFTADHGELLSRENAIFRWSHGLQLTHEVLEVPLLIRAPSLGVRPGRYEKLTRSIDLMPTIAGLAGLPLAPEADVQGVDLTPWVRGQADPPRLLAFSHTGIGPEEPFADPNDPQYAHSEELFPGSGPETVWVGVRDGDLSFKLRALDGRTWSLQAFDLANDPIEALDVFDPEQPRHRELADRLREFKARLIASFQQHELSATDDLSREERLERLRALGYVK